MARKKVKLEWIANDSARRATFKKRRNGLLKKVVELSTLCDVNACLIIYAPNEPQAEVWPSPHEATRVLAKLRSLPEMEQSKKMMNQEGFMRQRIGKLQEQLRKKDRENRELETTLLMHEGLMGRSMHDVDIRSLSSLSWLIELKAKVVQKRLESLRTARAAPKAMKEVVAETMPPPPTSMPMPMVFEAVTETMPLEAATEELQKQEWFSEMMMNPHDDILGHVPFFDHGSCAWLDAYFPFS